MKIHFSLLVVLLSPICLTNCTGDSSCRTEVHTIDSLTLSLPPLGLQVYRSLASVSRADNGEQLVLIGYNDRRHALELIPGAADAPPRSIQLSKEGPRSIPEVYYVLSLNEESIALFSRDQISLVGRQGTLLEKIRTQAKSDSTAAFPTNPTGANCS